MRGLDTARLCGAHKELASKDKNGHSSASGPRLGRVPDPRPSSPQGAPKHPQQPGRGSERAAGRQGGWSVRDAPLSRTPFLPKERGASGGPRHSTPQAGICLLWSLLPKAAGSSEGYLPEALASHVWLPWQLGAPRALAGWALWTLLTAGGRQGQADQSSVSQHPEWPGQLLPGGSAGPSPRITALRDLLLLAWLTQVHRTDRGAPNYSLS